MAAQQIRAQPARAADQSAAKDNIFKATAAAIKEKIPNKILTMSKTILIVKILSIMTVCSSVHLSFRQNNQYRNYTNVI